MGVDIVALDLHRGAVPDRALNHRRDLRGRAGQQLGVDGHRLAFHVPIDEHASATVARVPLGEQVLIERSEVGGVRRHCRGTGAPHTRSSGRVGGVGDLGGHRPRNVGGEVAAAYVAQVVLAVPMLAAGHRAEAGGGAEAYTASNSRSATTARSRSVRPAVLATWSRQPVRSTASLSMSINGTVPHRVRMSFFNARRFRGSGAASSGVSLIGPCLPRSMMSTQSRPGSCSSRVASSPRSSSWSSSMNAVGSSGLRSAV